MSNKDLLNWSADLRRIAVWLQTGNVTLAKKFIDRGKTMYSSGQTVGGRKWDWWFNEITQSNTLQAAERALTWSLILAHQTPTNS